MEEQHHDAIISREYSLTHSDDQLNNGDERHCRICLESEGELIIPCDCKTNPLHRTCLDRWRAEVKEGKNFERCEICHFTYEMESVSIPPSVLKSYYTGYCLTIAWVLFKSLVILVGGISFWGVVCGYLDRNREMLHVLNLSPGQSYLLWGIILFFLTIDLYGIYCMLKNDRGGCSGNGPSCLYLDCAGDATCFFAILCLIVAVITGIVIGLYFVSRDIKDASSKHLRVLGNYAQVDVTRVVDPK